MEEAFPECPNCEEGIIFLERTIRREDKIIFLRSCTHCHIGYRTSKPNPDQHGVPVPRLADDSEGEGDG